MKITSLKALEILDSRGNPTVRTFVELEDGSRHSSSAPSGASTGSHEAAELRDNDPQRYVGKGVLKAVENINSVINQTVSGMDVSDPKAIDRKMLELDGTENKSRLGANAILSVSQAVLKAAAHAQNKQLWQFINEYYFQGAQPDFPRLMVNIINGGKHAGWNFDIQEFMVVPKPTKPSESVRIASEIFQGLGKLLKEKSLSTLVGDEGGYSPNLSSNEEVIETIINASKTMNYELITNYDLALDCASTEWFEKSMYISHKTNERFSSEELREKYLRLQETFHIISFEDAFAEDDWEAWKAFTKEANNRHFMTVGDDLFVTSPKRIEKGIQEQAANAVLIKVNQIGTVFETVEAIKMTRNAGWKFIISHRSGETEDSFIADLAYGSGADFIKTGSMSRSERLAKYNRLLEIENNL